MDRKLVIVEYNNQILTAIYENDELMEFLFDGIYKNSIGNIYVGKVKNIVKNINAAFIEFDHHQKYGYYSLSDNTNHLYTSYQHARDKKLVPGDELLVQVVKDPIKTKPAMLDGHLTFAGQFMVLTVGKSFTGISEKIGNAAERARLKAIFEPLVTEHYGFIVRTQAQGKDKEVLYAEAKRLIDKFNALMAQAPYAACFSRLYEAQPLFIQYMDSHPDLTKVTTDIPSVYEIIQNHQKSGHITVPVSFYEDPDWPLAKVKSLETHISRALSPQVWLKSGGYLMIQPTEAMVVIDVNTGKYTGKKNQQETFFKINMEAAKEIARQLRLRNLSGIIMIDFIDMADANHRKQLLDAFKIMLQNDPIKAVLVGMTRLNIVEMTRKKERRPLHEQLKRKQESK